MRSTKPPICGRASYWSPGQRAVGNPLRWRPSSIRLTRKGPATSSPLKTPSSSCTRTSALPSTSANCTPTAPSAALALRAALRQAPKAILVGEGCAAHETIEVALEAAETGHLVFSTLHTIDASKTIERIIGVFAAGEQTAVRMRLAEVFRFIISQRLLPRRGGPGAWPPLRFSSPHCAPASTCRRASTRENRSSTPCATDPRMACSASTTKSKSSSAPKPIDLDIGLAYSTNAGNLRLRLADFLDPQSDIPHAPRVQARAGEKRPPRTLPPRPLPHALDPELEIEP